MCLDDHDEDDNDLNFGKETEVSGDLKPNNDVGKIDDHEESIPLVDL